MGPYFKDSDVQPMAPEGSSGQAAGSASASAAAPAGKNLRRRTKRAENSVQTKEQLHHISPQLRQLQAQAAQEGIYVKLMPAKGGGKGQSGKSGGKATGTTKPATTPAANKVQSQLPSLVREHGRPAKMDDGNGQLVPILWLCSFCHYPHRHNRASCFHCKQQRNRQSEPTTFIRSKVAKLGSPSVSVQPAIPRGLQSSLPDLLLALTAQCGLCAAGWQARPLALWVQ